MQSSQSLHNLEHCLLSVRVLEDKGATFNGYKSGVSCFDAVQESICLFVFVSWGITSSCRKGINKLPHKVPFLAEEVMNTLKSAKGRWGCST